jgi:hypothetical protein
MLKPDNLFWMSGAPKMTPFTTFSIIGHMLAYGLKAHKLAQYFGNGRFKILSLVHVKWIMCCRNMVISSFEVVEC